MLTKERFWVVGGDFSCEDHVRGVPKVLGPFATRDEAKAVRKRLAAEPGGPAVEGYRITGEKIVLPH